jgi:hypothetical protein
VDRWLLIGVAALIARIWTYHRVYDDVLILLPELALFRIAVSQSHRATIAGGLLGVTALAMLSPGWLLEGRTVWSPIFNTAHSVLWIAILVFLMVCSSDERKRADLPGDLSPPTG